MRSDGDLWSGGPTAHSSFRRGSALLSEGRTRQAIRALVEAVALEPRKAPIREALTRAYHRAREHAHARGHVKLVVPMRPDDLDYQRVLERNVRAS